MSEFSNLLEKLKAFPAKVETEMKNTDLVKFFSSKDALKTFKAMYEAVKIELPEDVADILILHQNKGNTLADVYSNLRSNKKSLDWLIDTMDAYDKVAAAWLFGFEIAEEEKYIVTLNGFSADYNQLIQNLATSRFYFGQNRTETHDINAIKIAFTENELKDAGLAWMLDSDGVTLTKVEPQG